MTVCIATIYGKNGNDFGLVVSADRLVTFEQGTFTVESKSPKIFEYKLEDKWDFVIAGTGGMNYIEDFNRRFRAIRSDDVLTLEDAAKKSSEVLQQMMKESAENTVLRPKGLTWERFYDKEIDKTQEISNYIVSGVAEQEKYFIEGIHLMLAGIDSSGPSIYIIEDFDYTSVGTLGYHAIGIGDRAARISLEHNNYDPRKGMHYSLLLNLMAKVQAEEAHGVGAESDCRVISLASNGTKMIRILPSTIKNIREKYIEDVKSRITTLLEKKAISLEKILEVEENDIHSEGRGYGTE